MSLELFNNISKFVKENNLVQDFVSELHKEINKINQTNKDNEKLLTEYRDKMNIERIKILNNYASKHADKPELLYIYDNNSHDADGYNACYLNENKSHEIVEIKAEELPEGARIGTAIAIDNGAYTIDQEATSEIAEQIHNLYSEIVHQQTEFLESKRIEGHEYEVSEVAEDRVWLFDITENADEAIEEIGISNEVLQEIKEGDILKYENGSYLKSIEA